ncbi:MAG: hypothetical protein R6X25_10120 [Candidatus Krumholzibacteriia bacterium]
MPGRPDPRRWAVCSLLAVALLTASVFLIPAAWIQRVFFPGVRRHDRAVDAPSPALELLPAVQVTRPTLLVVADPPVGNAGDDAAAAFPPDDLWWDTAWRTRWRDETAAAMGIARRDTSAALRRRLLGGVTDIVRRAEPDSATASHLARLFLTAGHQLGELRPFLLARGYALDFADLASREAELFDEHLFRQIMVTDSPADKLRDEQSRPPGE